MRKTIDGPDTLEPGLTKADKAVLAAVPQCAPIELVVHDPEMPGTIWQIAEVLDTEDLADLRRTLNGLMHLEYVCCSESRARKRRVYWRTRKGDEAIS